MPNTGLHHLHTRKRREPFPSPNGLKRFFDYLMYGVSVGVPLALVPQVHQVYSLKEVGDLSIVTWGLLCFFNILWTIYGTLHKAYPIMISSIATALLQLSLVIAILAYGH